jgi:hypothetical protein
MMRQDPDSGEIFEPTTVVNKFDLTSDTQITIPVVLDLVTREAIWCDLGLAHFPYAVNNVENNKISMQTIARSIAELSKPNLYDLFTLHAHARGTEMVETPEEADTVFSVHQGIKPTDFAEIAANFL